MEHHAVIRLHQHPFPPQSRYHGIRAEVAVIEVPRRHAPAVIEWLDREVSPNQSYRIPDSERTAESRLNPYSVSTTAQIAHWRGENDLWHVKQSSRNRQIEVQCQDPAIETLIALKWGG